jgi:hypothetical protein
MHAGELPVHACRVLATGDFARSEACQREDFVRIVLGGHHCPTILLPRRSGPYPSFLLHLSEHLCHVFHLIPDKGK